MMNINDLRKNRELVNQIDWNKTSEIANVTLKKWLDEKLAGPPADFAITR